MYLNESLASGGNYTEAMAAKTISVLYYLAPENEMDDPYFRYGTYKSILKPEMTALLDAGDRYEVSIIMSETIYQKALETESLDARIKYHIDSTGSASNDKQWYSGDADEDETSVQLARLERVLPAGYKPDIIMSYEKPARFLSVCFPDAVMLDVMFGAYSRAPYMTLASFDPTGLFGNSFPARHAEKIRSLDAGDEGRAFIKELRRKAGDAIAEFQPYKRKIAEIRQKFSKIIMVACQVDGYFAVTETSNYKTQFDMVLDICKSVPSDIGVIVTQHAYKPSISEEQRDLLEKAFTNIVIFKNDKKVTDTSQFLIPYMDAVATIGSSLAFQATLWQVPVIAMGRTHINVIASGADLDVIEPIVRNGMSKEEIKGSENALYFLLTRYNKLYRTKVFRSQEYSEELLEMLESFREDKSGESYFFDRDINIEALLEDYKEAFRKYALGDWVKKSGTLIEKDYLLWELSNHKVATFDLFDTILQRPIIEPHEAFLLMEPAVQKFLNNRNFAYHRARREAEADVRRPTKGEYEVILQEIYRKMAQNTGITIEQSMAIMEMEKRYELQLCSIKPKIYLYYKFARLLCDKVGVVSDFYIEEDFVKELLQKNDIATDFLYVSATTKTRKHNGTIFPQIKKDVAKMGYSLKEMIHIGDNKIADKEMAERNGVKGYHFPKASENLKRSLFGKMFAPAFRNSGLGSSIVFGLFANRFYGTTWNQIDASSMFRGDPLLLGYVGFGPLMVGFCQWLRREVKIKGYKKIFFLARDGYIVKEVYERLYGKSEDNVYLYASRRAATVASLRSVEEIIELAHQSFNAQPIADFLKNRFGFELKKAHAHILAVEGLSATSIVSPTGDISRIVSVLTVLSDEILENAEKERENYLEYLDKTGYIETASKDEAVVVDIGYSGTMQYYLMRLVQNTKVDGLYMLTHQHARHFFDDVEFSGYLASFDDHRISYRHKLNDHVFIFEAGLSSLEGSLLRFDKKEGRVNPVFLEAEEEENRKKMLSRIHAGVINFSADYKANLGELIDAVSLSPLMAEKVLVSFADNPSGEDADIFYGNEVENLFGGGSVCLIEPCGELSSDKKMRTLQIDEMILRSKWKNGAKAFYSAHTWSKESKGLKKPIIAPQIIKKQRKNRKLAKLANNPYLFFSDSKKPYLRMVRHAFGLGLLGRINTFTVKKIVGMIG